MPAQGLHYTVRFSQKEAGARRTAAWDIAA
jgi:hypothetical protein